MLQRQRGGFGWGGVVHLTSGNPFIWKRPEAYSDIMILPRVVPCVWNIGYSLESWRHWVSTTNHTAVIHRLAYPQKYTDMRHLTTGIRSEKCVVRQFRHCANVYLHKPRQYSPLHI